MRDPWVKPVVGDVFRYKTENGNRRKLEIGSVSGNGVECRIVDGNGIVVFTRGIPLTWWVRNSCKYMGDGEWELAVENQDD